jgi:hypothetical protein
MLSWEIVALFSVSLGASGLRSLVSLIGSLTEPESLSAAHRDQRVAGGGTNPMIIAHTLINAVAFIGYTLLAPHASWLP